MANWNDLFGGGLPKLAPDLTYPSDKLVGGASYKRITGIDGSSALVTALSLSGKFYINFIRFSGLIAESMTFKLTIDGVIVWNNSFTVTATEVFLGTLPNSTLSISETIQCDTSFLLEIQTTTDTDVTLDFLARPIS